MIEFNSEKEILDYSRFCAIERALKEAGERTTGGVVASAVTPNHHVWVVCRHGGQPFDSIAYPELRAGDVVGVIFCFVLQMNRAWDYRASPQQRRKFMETAWSPGLPMAESGEIGYFPRELPTDCPLEFLHMFPKYLRPSQEWREAVYRHHGQVLPYELLAA